jgi:hypothetical protein
MNPYKYRISLRIFHPDLNPVEIIKKLGTRWKIKRVWRAGDPRKTPQGKLLGGTYDSTYCLLIPTSVMETNLPDVVDALIKRLKYKKKFINSLECTGGRVELYVACFIHKNCGEVFDWKTLIRLGECRINLAFDIYPNVTDLPTTS